MNAKLLSMMMAGLAGLAAASGAGAASSVENAPIKGDVPAVAITYDARSLGNESGVRALYVRIVAASRTVCPEVSVGHFGVGAATAKCRQEAVERAVKQVNDPRLAALYVTRAKSG